MNKKRKKTFFFTSMVIRDVALGLGTQPLTKTLSHPNEVKV